MDTSSTERTDRVVINLVVEVDLEKYAEDYDLAGVRSARDDLKSVVLSTVKNQLELMGIPRGSVYRR
ncbi:hypothetical protein SEA_GHOULBOY_74 [Mycobacterium phage Ghoulboy]|nr:hypothetical protein SEA_GHOULBOY_74 [Mycobacterium phage Ghoulboy]